MTQNEKDLRMKIADLQTKVLEARANGNMDDAESLMQQAEGFKAELMAAEEKRQADLAFEARINALGDFGIEVVKETPKIDAKDVFIRAIKGTANREEIRAALLTEGDGSQAFGLTVPKDVVNTIYELKRTLNPLEDLVRVENVSTMYGSRVIENLSNMTAFAKVAEDGRIQNTDAPQVKALDYRINKYAGLLPITNELREDSAENIERYITNWFAKKDVVTRNTEILNVFKTLSATPLAGLDAFKQVLNVTLDPVFMASSVVITNQDGLQYLDTLKDADNNYVLQKDVTNPTKRVLFGVLPVHVVANTVMPTNSKKVPFVIGDTKEAVVLFDRKAPTIDVTNSAAGAFEHDQYILRGITRFDVKKFDEKAAVFGEVTLP